MRFIRQLGLVAVALAFGACGGGTPSGSTPGASVGATASSPGSSSAATSPAPAAATTSGGVDGVCDLVAATELGAILGATVTTHVIAGPPDTCDVQADGAPLAALVLTTSGGAQVFDILATGSGAQAVAGIGDAAFFSDETLLLVVKKGDRMLSVATSKEGITNAERLDLLKRIATAAAGRM